MMLRVFFFVILLHSYFYAMGPSLSSFLIAASNGNLQQVRTLVERDEDVNQTDSQFCGNAAFWALENNHDDIVRYLIRHTRIKINHKNALGSSLLIFACSKENGMALCDFLLNQNLIDVTIENTSGRTALHYILVHSDFSPERVRTILELGGRKFKQKWGTYTVSMLNENLKKVYTNDEKKEQGLKEDIKTLITEIDDNILKKIA